MMNNQQDFLSPHPTYLTNGSVASVPSWTINGEGDSSNAVAGGTRARHSLNSVQTGGTSSRASSLSIERRPERRDSLNPPSLTSGGEAKEGKEDRRASTSSVSATSAPWSPGGIGVAFGSPERDSTAFSLNAIALEESGGLSEGLGERSERGSRGSLRGFALASPSRGEIGQGSGSGSVSGAGTGSGAGSGARNSRRSVSPVSISVHSPDSDQSPPQQPNGRISTSSSRSLPRNEPNRSSSLPYIDSRSGPPSPSLSPSPHHHTRPLSAPSTPSLHLSPSASPNVRPQSLSPNQVTPSSSPASPTRPTVSIPSNNTSDPQSQTSPSQRTRTMTTTTTATTNTVPSSGPQSPADPEALYILSTYARLSREGVRGDGWEEGKELTREGTSRRDAGSGHPSRDSVVSGGQETSRGCARGNGNGNGNEIERKEDEKEWKKEEQLLSKADRYGFFSSPSHSSHSSHLRLVLLPCKGFKVLPPSPKSRFHATTSGRSDASIPAPPSPFIYNPDTDDSQNTNGSSFQTGMNGGGHHRTHTVSEAQQFASSSTMLRNEKEDETKARAKELERIDKWARMLKVERKDEGGNVIKWDVGNKCWIVGREFDRVSPVPPPPSFNVALEVGDRETGHFN